MKEVVAAVSAAGPRGIVTRGATRGGVRDNASEGPAAEPVGERRYQAYVNYLDVEFAVRHG